MYIRASAPDAPPFSDTTIGCFIRLFFWMAACIMRAIWSEAPPAPAATTISTGLVGSQPAASAGAPASMTANAAVALMIFRTCFFPLVLTTLLSSSGRPTPAALVARDWLIQLTSGQLQPPCLLLSHDIAGTDARQRPAAGCARALAVIFH